MKSNLLSIVVFLLLIVGCKNNAVNVKKYDGHYTGQNLDHIAYPIGGIGTGMFCFEGTGTMGSVSLYHAPNLFFEPQTFAAISVKGLKNGAKILETNVPKYKIFGRNHCGRGLEGSLWGLPRFTNGEFYSRFPFANLKLQDDDIPLDINICVWNPFIPNDIANSSLPVATYEYTFKNTSSDPVEAVYSFNTENFMYKTNETKTYFSVMDKGVVLNQEPTADKPYLEGHFAIFSDDPETTCDYGWFRGRWYDHKTMAWKKVAECDTTSSPVKKGSLGCSIMVPVKLQPGESKTVRLYMAWYVPCSNFSYGNPPKDKSDYGNYYDEKDYIDYPKKYIPWYATRFKNIEEVVSYWKENYDNLKAQTKLFTDTFYDSSLPAEVIDVISSTMTILKSTTVLLQHDGRLMGFEGSEDTWGSCNGTTTHVWNYAQAMAHLFPSLERTLRETEFFVSQNTEGHQMFRGAMPIGPIAHDKYAAADGQLGGIIKVYRDWRISGDNEWIKKLYPAVKASLDYCIRTWDPKEIGAIEEPHHNTYDIQFWGADGMCTSIYAAALEGFIEISKEFGYDAGKYEDLLTKSKAVLNNDLWNGEYFYQKVRWKDLVSPAPTEVDIYKNDYSEEAYSILEKEGPKYQYGNGCLSDGVIGAWMALNAGLPEPMDPDKTAIHLNSVFKYNFRENLLDHVNPQRPTYAMGYDGGLLLCTWPKGDMLTLPFIYCNEVWTGIEYQVAAHLMYKGEIEKGLKILRKNRERYDGSLRNPFNEYECGNWYIRALSSYSMLQALTGVRYDAVSKILYIDSKIGDFRSFLSTAFGYATVELNNGEVTVSVKSGDIQIDKCINSGKEIIFKYN